MIDFILHYWVEFILGVISAVVTAMFAMCYRKLVQKGREQESMREGILAILHDRLYLICQYHLGQGEISPNALKNIEYIYKSYHKLGGNGTGTELYQRVKKLPLTLEGVDYDEN